MRLAALLLFAFVGMTFSIEPAVPGYTPTLRLDAKDAGIILRHGDGPNQCDINGAREPTLIEEDGKYFLFYDGGGLKGWLACLATSTDLKTWTKHGPVLDFGKPGEPDAGSALSPWFVKEGDTWHMYYVTAEGTAGPPGFVAAGPYNSGHASSKSLMGPWVKTKGYIPVKPKPPGAGYPQTMAYPGHIVKKPDGEFLMFFGSPGVIGIARTRDLLGDWKPDAAPLFDKHFDLENSSVYFEPENKTWFLFVNHIKATPPMFTDAIWVFWTKDLEKWSSANRAIALDGLNCTWSKRCIGMATVTKVGTRLAMVYDAAGGESIDHLGRDIGLTWYDLPLVPPTSKVAAPTTVRDRLWSWAHDASFDWPAHEAGETPGKNRMTPVEGAMYLGVPNVMFIQYQGIPAAPFEQYYTPFKAMKQVYWTLSNNGNHVHQLGKEQDHVFQLAAAHPNITGLLLDDFLIGPINPKDDSHWLAENSIAFPVSLTLQWPQAVEADALQLTQSDWPDGGYLTGKFAVDVSNDGAQWKEVIADEMPDEAGAAKKLSFPVQSLRFLRVRVLSSLDEPVAMSARSCGLKGVTLMHKGQPIALTGAQFQASSEYPGHEAGRLASFNPATAGQAKVFSSQVSPHDLAEAKRRMQDVGGRKLDLAVVVYSNQLDAGIVPILADVDVVLFWTWKASDLRHLERNLRRLKELLPGKRVVLGCYLWDFSNAQLMPPELMQKQSELGLAWLKAGEIDGMIFLGTNIMDKNLKSVAWTREWIAKVGKEALK